MNRETDEDLLAALAHDPMRRAADVRVVLPNVDGALRPGMSATSRIAVGEAAQERHAAVAVFIDEIQYFNQKELGALIMAMHRVQQLQLPVILLGGVTNRETMDRAMADGFEFVAMGRALLREPDLIRRYEERQASTSLCVHCNKCMPTIYSRTLCVVTGAPG